MTQSDRTVVIPDSKPARELTQLVRDTESDLLFGVAIGHAPA